MGKSSLKKIITSLTVIVFVMLNLGAFAENTDKSNIEKNNNNEKYEEVKVGDNKISSYEYDINIKKEEKEKMEAMKEFKILKPKTDSKFEVALAYSDGSYSYKERAESYDDAIKKVKGLEESYTDNEIIPCVINSDGQVVYATNSMGRVWNHRNGEAILDGSLLTYLYTKPESSPNGGLSYTYINQLSIDDVPIVEERDTVAKIQVNGFTGWINKDVASKNYDLVVVPINQVNDPSCYYVKNGLLYHYITKNMTSGKVSGNSIRVGIAPSYLKEGMDYYSYDGVYFYEGKTIEEGLNKLITDLKNDTKKNAINSENPNYNYYEYLPFRTKTNYTAEELNKFIENNIKDKPSSKLRGIGEVLIECQNKYGVNPLLALGVAINESGWATSDIAIDKNNLFSVGAVDSDAYKSAEVFATVADCVRDFAEYQISRAYADPANSYYFGGYLGNKQLGTNVNYASDPYWGEKAAQHAFEIDYELSNYDIKNLKDNNGYQLATYTGANEVKDINGRLLYKINPNISGYGGYPGNIVALKFPDKTSDSKYKIFPEITVPMYDGGSLVKYHGKYDFSSFAYINSENVKLINTPKNDFIPGYYKEDSNRDGKVDVLDLDEVSTQYNKLSNDSGFKNYLDLNNDGIVDILDIVKVSIKIGV